MGPVFVLGKFTNVPDYFSEIGAPPQTVKPFLTQFRLLSLNPSDIYRMIAIEEFRNIVAQKNYLSWC